MKLKSLPILFNIVSKIEMEEMIEEIKKIDIADPKKMSSEEVTEIGLAILKNLLPQLGKFSNDIIPLISTIKGISKEEAEEIDIGEALQSLVEEKGIINFFRSALSKKIEPKS